MKRQLDGFYSILGLMSERTIFHKILDRELPATIVYEDDEVLAIKDIHPKDVTHLLFIPKQFTVSIAKLTPETEHLPGLLILKARDFAREKGIEQFRILFDGRHVPYLHLHFMSEQALP